MDNTNLSLLDLFKLSSFRIPQYQRAYSWDVAPQLTTFLSDLRQQVEALKQNPEKTYFLGTLLLHEISGKCVDVVDGQQRLTTSVTFIAAAIKQSKTLNIFPSGEITLKQLSNYFLYNEIDDLQKFRTIAEDNPFFRQYILGIENTELTQESPSAIRLKKAFDYFIESVSPNEWEALVSALINSKVMVYSVQNSADATLIFELQNDRGKKLTDLESLKSFLMHLIYLNTSNPEEGLQVIQTQFSKIYRHIEQQSANHRVPKEDAILAYHCVAYLDWSDDEWRNPKALIKKLLQSEPKENIRKWVLEFVGQLQETYKTFSTLVLKLDNYSAFSHLFVLDRMASFWPIIIKTFHYDKSESKSDFQLACRLMEVFAFRGYGLGNLRADAGLSSIYRQTKLFSGDFSQLHTYLYGMSNWYEIEDRFNSGIDRAALYKSNRKDVLYLLWRYENYLRSQKGKVTPHISWRDYIFPKDDASRLSIEHIAAQSNPISGTEVEWEKGILKIFSDVALHRLGNLVLDSKSANSSKGKYDFSDKLESLSKDSTFLSQGELIKWAYINTDNIKEWSVKSVRLRHSDLKKFVKTTWNPDNYFIPPKTVEIPQEPEEISKDISLEINNLTDK